MNFIKLSISIRRRLKKWGFEHENNSSKDSNPFIVSLCLLATTPTAFAQSVVIDGGMSPDQSVWAFDRDVRDADKEATFWFRVQKGSIYHVAFPALFGLAYPYIAAANLVMVIIWILFRRWYALISALALAAGFGYIPQLHQVHQPGP